MIDVSIYFAYIATILLLIVTPGPVVSYVVYVAAKYNKRSAILTAVMTNLGSLLLIAVASLIILGAFKLDDNLFDLISLLGSGLLIYLAISMFMSAKDNKSLDSLAEIDTQSRRGKMWAIFLKGFMIAIANPKDILFFVALFPQFLNLSGQIEVSLGVLTLTWIICDLTILSMYAHLIHHPFLKKRLVLITQLSSLILLALGILGIVYYFV